MSLEFRMPSLGADMEAGTLVEWLVKPGDVVKRGDIVAVVETDKGAIEVEIFDSGVVDALLVGQGEKVPVGTLLARLRPTGEPAAPPSAPEHPPTAPPARPAVEAPLAPSPEATPVRLRASPLARRLAQELGVDLTRVQGTGPGGAITKEDVEKAAAQTAPPAVALPEHPGVPVEAPPERPGVPTVREVPAAALRPPAAAPTAMRRAIATAMARSNREIPHYYLQTSIDMKRALDWLEAENLKRPVTERLLPVVLLLKAVALAAREIPEMNGFWEVGNGNEPGAFRPSEAIHVGVAISLRQGGLVAPAIHHTDLKSLDELMRELRDLVTRARSGMLRSSELSDPTITVSNLGEQGVETVFGVIYPPQVALVGFGKIVERPWAVGGLLGVRPILTATLAADHRASDGHRGGRFLAAIDRLLQEPETL